MTQEALKLALEALETPWNARYVDGCDLALGKRVKAIPIIKEALAQTQEPKIGCVNHDCDKCKAQTQEPVAYLSNKQQRLNIELKPQTFVEIPTATDWEMPLYMKPPQRTWVGLTDEDCKGMSAGDKVVAMWADRTLKEKNT